VLDQPIEYLKAFLKDGRISPSEVKFLILVGGSTRLPIIRAKLKALLPSSIDILGINPDLVVAEGAAMLAAQIVRLFLCLSNFI